MMGGSLDSVITKPILQGEYKLIKVIQKLSYGTYYLATSLHNPARRWAIKEIELDFDSPALRQKLFRFFENEASRYLALKHPRLMPLENYFFEKNYEYLVFEYIPGHRLSEIIQLRREPFSESQVLDLAQKVAEGLEYLHGQGMVFHDLQPSNIIITPQGNIILTDYGLGKVIAPRNDNEPLWGTLGYAPPEQFGSQPIINQGVDIYALGIIMHQMLTFWDPTMAGGVIPLVEKLNSGISREMTALIKNATYEDPGLRYPTVKAFLKDLYSLMRIQPEKSRENAGSWLKRIARQLTRPFAKSSGYAPEEEELEL